MKRLPERSGALWLVVAMATTAFNIAVLCTRLGRLTEKKLLNHVC
jgi:hypothetical protein